MEKHIIHLKNKTEAQAFMKFLVMERNRHTLDISKLTQDINQLRLIWHIPVPAVPDNAWIEV